MLSRVFKLRLVVESLSDEDMNFLAENLKGEDLIEFSKAKGFRMLAKLLMRRPGLVAKARKLL